MNKFLHQVLNILLFPVKMYQRLTDKKATLAEGIVLIGAVDLLLPDAVGTYKQLFDGKTQGVMLYNALLTAGFVVLLGLVDIIFTAVPLFDFFRFIKKREDHVYSNDPTVLMGYGTSLASYIRVMKVYIMSHFMIVPVSTILYLTLLKDISQGSPVWKINLSLTMFVVLLVWAAAAIARGINALFRFSMAFRRFTFLVVFIWYYILGLVFNLEIMQWLQKLYK